tara:strand:- start:53 stop:316 length:264 start_codon:yes stop_codon:yes gene_type:complete
MFTVRLKRESLKGKIMSGYALVIGNCYVCKQMFSFNPHKVPSIRVDGIKQALCSGCMKVINEKREAINLTPFEINPEAYEAISEWEL